MKKFIRLVMIKFILFALVPFSLTVNAQQKEEWISRYNGTINWIDVSKAIVLDKSENVYITGFVARDTSDFDWTTIKYCSNSGGVLWKIEYSRSDKSYDEPVAIAIDDSEYIYVTGFSGIPSTNATYIVTAKYNKNGNQLWVSEFGKDGLPNYPKAIIVDNFGNVYVTGMSDWDCVTIKYDRDGNQLWTVYYNGPADGSDEGAQLKINKFGNVYVGVTSEVALGISDFIIIKYDKNGNQLWEKRYDGPSQTIDILTDLEIDVFGNIYVIGSSESDHEGFIDNDYVTIKLSTDGDILWIARYDGGWGGDYPIDLEVDNYQNVYITGWSIDSLGAKSYATIKYDSQGNKKWDAQYRGKGLYNEPSTLILDTNENIYVTGFIETVTMDLDWAVIKYDNKGDKIWVVTYNGPGNDWDVPNDIAIGETGNVYVTGFSTGIGTDWDYTTIKFSDSKPIGVNDKGRKQPDVYNISQNYPNPFNSSTIIRFSIPQTTSVTLKIFDSLGREVETLIDDKLNSGEYEVRWNASKFSSGIYLYYLKAGNYSETKKLLYLK